LYEGIVKSTATVTTKIYDQSDQTTTVKCNKTAVSKVQTQITVIALHTSN